jgi:hypothetical protein
VAEPLEPEPLNASGNDVVINQEVAVNAAAEAHSS